MREIFALDFLHYVVLHRLLEFASKDSMRVVKLKFVNFTRSFEITARELSDVWKREVENPARVGKSVVFWLSVDLNSIC